MKPEGRDFIQRDPDQDQGTTPPGGCWAPVAITRVQLAITKPYALPLETFVGPDAEAHANALLLDLCHRIPPGSDVLGVMVVATFADGYEYHAVHRLHAEDSDGTVRSHVLGVLRYLQSHPTYRLHYAIDASMLDALMTAVAGRPDQVRFAHTLRRYAVEQQQRSAHQYMVQHGMEEYYSHLLHRLDLGMTAKEAIVQARQDAETPLLPGRGAAFEIPDEQDAQVLLGIHGAWKAAQHFFGELRGAA